MKKKTGRDSGLHTLQFTRSERQRIQRGAAVCGWRVGESAQFARQLLLRVVAAILKGQRRPH